MPTFIGLIAGKANREMEMEFRRRLGPRDAGFWDVSSVASCGDDAGLEGHNLS